MSKCRYLNKFSVFALMTAGVFLSTSPQLANAAGNGSNPKGKPFVAIDNQIVEVEGAISSLQDQIDLLVARVDTVEERVTANEEAISTLQDQNLVLETLIQQDITAIEAEIVSLEEANIDLQAMIADNSGDIAALQTEVDTNAALITTLQSALETSIQAQIDNNATLIAALRSEVDLINEKLELKQNLVNGTCPNGQAIQQILNDGSVICEVVGGTSGQLHSKVSIKILKNVVPGQLVSVKAFCEPGYTATGAGFSGTDGWSINNNYTGADSSSENWGVVSARNDKTFNDFLFSVTTCTRIAP